MACLSVYNPDGAGPAVVCANPIHLLGSQELRRDAELPFEVLEQDASSLKKMIGEHRLFVLHSQAFWGTLQRLEPSPTPILGKPALSGLLHVYAPLEDGESTAQN